MYVSTSIATAPINSPLAQLTPAINKAQTAVTRQESTIVSLSTAGLSLSRGDRALSSGERSESTVAESSEPISVQYMEGEIKGGRIDTAGIHG